MAARRDAAAALDGLAARALLAACGLPQALPLNLHPGRRAGLPHAAAGDCLYGLALQLAAFRAWQLHVQARLIPGRLTRSLGSHFIKPPHVECGRSRHTKLSDTARWHLLCVPALRQLWTRCTCCCKRSGIIARSLPVPWSDCGHACSRCS